MSEALETDPGAYASFNDFFIRALKPQARNIVTGDGEIACPADGTISQIGAIEDGRIIQAKRMTYDARELLAGIPQAAAFDGGRFITIYLSPRDYHRVHMPCDGQLRHMIYVPGRLFSVAPHTTRAIPRLFTRNERMVALFDTTVGQMAVAMVGAINVGAIETTWAGLVTPSRGNNVNVIDYREHHSPELLRRGTEMGRFNLGSTVIVLFENTIEWDSNLGPATRVLMGQRIATKITSPQTDGFGPS
jgi:phosphatidylserine decarboxylase